LNASLNASMGQATGPGTQAAATQARLSEEVRAAFDYLPATLAGNLAGLAVVGGMYAGLVPGPVFSAWLAAFVAMLLARALLGWRFARLWRTVRSQLPEDGRASAMDWPRWRLGWNIGTLCSGALWGATAWIFFGVGDGNQQTALVITVYTFCIAAVPVLATQPRVYASFAALCFVPLIARLLLDGTRHSLELAGILTLIFTLTSVLARSFRDTVSRALDLKLRSDDLARALLAEREATEAARAQAEVARSQAEAAGREADAARRVAEAASRAKTQFFAAASHDLRQPLHALGLFAEALSQRQRKQPQAHDHETQSLVTSVQASVDALEGLFSQLMDINRIDAGGVQNQPQGLRLQTLFDRLAVHLGPEAFDRGLSLRWRGGQQLVNADPLLLERVLRNLVGNALRYTVDGGVLVGARRSAHSVRLQVWDTGVGIAAEDQGRIFEEFVQLQARPAETGAGVAANASANKGLGLGLAIVQRLCGVMGVPLTLRSQRGRGTCFEIRLPVGEAVSLAPSEEPVSLRMPAFTVGQHALVVEDDAAVRTAIASLLQSWGWAVSAFDGADTVLALAAEQALGEVQLLVVDYRLQGALSGIDVIDRLRSAGITAPALVVTGSASAGLEQEARERGVPVLSKPVPPARLRAAMVALLEPTGQLARVSAEQPVAETAG
jgi:two-component system, sensor histidine kinase